MSKKQVLTIIVIIVAFAAMFFIEHVHTQYKSEQLEKEYFAELNDSLDRYGRYQRTIYDM